MKAKEFGEKAADIFKRKCWLEKQRRTAIYFGNDGWRFKVEKQLRAIDAECAEMSKIAPFVTI